MSTRKYHSKSRNGCRTCKRRHVKCDEQGPPCANCIVRGSVCEHDALDGTADPGTQFRELALTSSRTVSPAESTSSQITTFPSKLLELELMHRWSTSTWKSVCSVPEEQELLQVMVPRDAMKHDFLLHGILAMAALDMAATACPPGSHEAKEYVRAAIELYDRAIVSYRARLGSITEENHLPFFIFSILLIVINITLPRCTQGEDGRVSTKRIFELLKGLGPIIFTSLGWMLRGPLKVREAFQEVSTSVLCDDDIMIALARLRALNDGFYNAGDAGVIAAYPNAAADHELYDVAISCLERCFALDDGSRYKASCVGWPVMVGREFAEAMERSEPMALVILMHWAVLVHGLDRVPEYWWANHAGQDMMIELSDALLVWRPALPQEWRDCISWARQQAGLTKF